MRFLNLRQPKNLYGNFPSLLPFSFVQGIVSVDLLSAEVLTLPQCLFQQRNLPGIVWSYFDHPLSFLPRI